MTSRAKELNSTCAGMFLPAHSGDGISKQMFGPVTS